MSKLPHIAIINAFLAGIFVLFFPEAKAIEIASQTQGYSATLPVSQVIQELGNNLNGNLDKFTFRIKTIQPSKYQFDYTAENTKIYDKTANNYIGACVPLGSDPANMLRGLVFDTPANAPGYQNVTIDFSCRNYVFIPEHKYLILITSANMGGPIYFAANQFSGNNDYFPAGGLRYPNGNKYDTDNNRGSCDAVKYVYGSQTNNNGCLIWNSSKDDLYFSLTNNAPPPKEAVIFIPGIGGSELKANQDIVWSQDNGHGGNYSYAYKKDEKIWVNQDQAAKFGNDDYFDVLRLKPDGQSSEADISLTGNLTSFGYGEVEPFFQETGYEKGKNFFVYTYDWRKDVRNTKDSLDSLIETAKQKSGQNRVNIVAHSMGGLVARYYISDSAKAAKVNKLIELGVPHLGAVGSIKSIMYGASLKSKIFGLFPVGIPASEVKDTSQSYTGIFELMPSSSYFDFYDNSNNEKPYPFLDIRDIDDNKITGALGYGATKNLFNILNYNMNVFNLSEQFHGDADKVLNQTNGVKTHLIVGSSQPTLGQIKETWWITWPANIIPKTEEIFINGDDTVPLYSASLKNDSLDLSGGAKIYYIEQKHADLVSKNGAAMQTVKAILAEENLPVDVKSEKIVLEGYQISLDDGELELYDENGNHTGIKNNGEEIETNIDNTYYSTNGKSKNAFIKKKAKKVTVKTTRINKISSDPKTTNLKISQYINDKISKIVTYKDIAVDKASKVEFALDPISNTNPTLTLYPDSSQNSSLQVKPTSQVENNLVSDQTPPQTAIIPTGNKNSSGQYIGSANITLTATDSSSGVLNTEYSLDNGQNVQTYTNPFTIDSTGTNTIQTKSTDKAGNEEIIQSLTFEIMASPSANTSSNPPTSSTSTQNSSSNTKSSAIDSNSLAGSNNTDSSSVIQKSEETKKDQSPKTAVLGISYQNTQADSANLNTIKETKTLENEKISEKSFIKPKTPILKNLIPQTLSELFIISGSILAITSAGLTFTLIKPPPK